MPMVTQLEAQTRGSEKPVEDEGPVCIRDGGVSLEVSAEHEEKGK